MTYQCGMNFPGARRDPAIVCDGCGLRRSVTTRSGLPAKWFLDLKPAPGWAMVRREDAIGLYRRDWCPRCKQSPPPEPPAAGGGE